MSKCRMGVLKRPNLSTYHISPLQMSSCVSYFLCVQGIVCIAIATTKSISQTASTSSTVMFNMLVPESQLGTVNGIASMAATLGGSSGSLLGGLLWGLSASLHFPGHQFLSFLVPPLTFTGCWFLHCQITSSFICRQQA